jgi:hypothetical protein
MPTPTSEYRIPIFISSTDYNLKDLRNELSRYLSELGYQPILSSAEGFHDSSPTMEPWESCLEVLSTCPIMLLIIDNRYGGKLSWKNYAKIITTEVAPTHGEYLFAHNKQKRLLVFIREEILTYYQIYRQVKHDTKGNTDETKARIEAILPKNSHIEYEVFPFIEQVKTTKPIPWIKSFKDVTDLKQEVHKKLLNELAVVFLIKERQTEIVTSALSKILEESSEEKRREILQSMGSTRELMEKYESQSKTVADLSMQMQELAVQADGYKVQLVKANKVAERDETKIKELETKFHEVQNYLGLKKRELEFWREHNTDLLSKSSIYNVRTKYLLLDDDFLNIPDEYNHDQFWNISRGAARLATESDFAMKHISDMQKISSKAVEKPSRQPKVEKKADDGSRDTKQNEENGKNNIE